VRLLFDQNLSFKLVRRLADIYPDSAHVRDAGLVSAEDSVVWNHARTHGFVIVSKDSDFYQRSLVVGHPPKIVWIRSGNCSTTDIEAILRRHVSDLLVFEHDPAAAFLILL
jgi:predicted nuclease of predicted toxin-antitoxin system